jgi:hypothetical protein
MNDTTFYLGGDVAALSWGVPVMVSHGRLRSRKTLPRATAPWVCDSRGFTELSQYGRWTFGPDVYAQALLRYAEEIGQLVWASPQDWMVEEWILAKTGLTILNHQERTIESVLRLRGLLAGQVHVIPVLQGQAISDYHRHDRMYAAAGVNLRAEPVVGLGSVCRRQASREIDALVSSLEATGLRLHGFGVKTDGLASYGPLLTSADSFAWSLGARRDHARCPHGLVKWEANCPERALEWRGRVLAKLRTAQLAPRQLDLFPAFGGAA